MPTPGSAIQCNRFICRRACVARPSSFCSTSNNRYLLGPCTWIISLFVALIVAAVTVAYAAFLPQISGESSSEWLGLAALVFVPWFALAALSQHTRRIRHLGAARLVQVAALAGSIYGVTNSRAMDLPTAAAHFAAYVSVTLVACIAVWWVADGFSKHRSK